MLRAFWAYIRLGRHIYTGLGHTCLLHESLGFCHALFLGHHVPLPRHVRQPVYESADVMRVWKCVLVMCTCDVYLYVCVRACTCVCVCGSACASSNHPSMQIYASHSAAHACAYAPHTMQPHWQKPSNNELACWQRRGIWGGGTRNRLHKRSWVRCVCGVCVCGVCVCVCAGRARVCVCVRACIVVVMSVVYMHALVVLAGNIRVRKHITIPQSICCSRPLWKPSAQEPKCL